MAYYQPPPEPDQTRYDYQATPAPSSPPVPPYGQPYPQPPAYQPVVVTNTIPTSGMATGAMVVGIIGALGGWCMLGLPCLVAILLGHQGMKETKDGSRGGRGQAVTGLILGYLFIVPWALIFVTFVMGSMLSAVSPTPTSTP